MTQYTDKQTDLLAIWQGAIIRLAREKTELRRMVRLGFREDFLRDQRGCIAQCRTEEQRAMADFRATLLPEGIGRDFIGGIE